MQTEQQLEELTAGERNAARSSRVHWWQQAETTSLRKIAPPPTTSVSVSPVQQAIHPNHPPTMQTVVPQTVVAPPAQLDICEELEEEARQRSIAEASGERVVIYADNHQNIARMKKRMLWSFVPMTVIYGILSLIEPSLFAAIWAFMLIECAVLYQYMRRMYLRQTHPAVVLTDAGIEIHTLGHDIGLIHWHEIGDIRAYNLIYRYVGITPRDSKALCQRLTKKQGGLIRANEFVIPMYRFFRTFVAPINLAQQVLPISADALVAKIEAFRAVRRV